MHQVCNVLLVWFPTFKNYVMSGVYLYISNLCMHLKGGSVCSAKDGVIVCNT